MRTPSQSARQPHTRLRKYQSKNARYGTEQQPLDCDFAMTVRQAIVWSCEAKPAWI